MNVAKTLSLLFAPAAFGACNVDFYRTNISEPISNDWATAFGADIEAFLAGASEANNGNYALWSVIAGSLLQNTDCLDIPLDGGATKAELEGDEAGNAFMCLNGNDACTVYRVAQTDCAQIPFPLPGEYCTLIPECSDLYTDAIAGLTEISVKWNGGANADQITLHTGYGCSGPALDSGDAVAEGGCQPMFSPQQFNIQVWNGAGRNFQTYGNNFLQMTLNALVCANYNQTCLGGVEAAVDSFCYFGQCLAQDSCALANNSCANGATPACGGGSGSDSDSDAVTFAPVALLAVGALLF
jgi:hypothetical protein